MQKALNSDGDQLIVLTPLEYATLTEDAGDIALARAAKLNDQDAPTMDAELVSKVIAGDLHPLAAWRKSLGLKAKDLAEKAGVRQATISDIENFKLDPQGQTWKKIAEAIGLSIDDIM